MSELARQLAADRANRDAARQLFETGIGQVRADLEARGVGGRIKAKASAEVMAVLDEAVEIAAENRGIVAATIAALVLWFARNPIIAFFEQLIAPDGNDVETGRLDDPHEINSGETDSDREDHD